MITRTESPSQLPAQALSWMVSVAPAVLFLIAILFAFAAGRTEHNNLQTTAAFIQNIAIAVVLLVVSLQIELSQLNARRVQQNY